MLLRIEAFTHTHKLLDKEVFTQRSFYTQKLLHGEVFTQRSLYAHTQGSFTHRSFYPQKLLHTEAFIQTSFCTKKPWHREVFTQGSFYTQRSVYTENPCHRGPLWRCKTAFYWQFLPFDFHFVRNGCIWDFKIAIFHQFLTFDLHFVRDGCASEVCYTSFSTFPFDVVKLQFYTRFAVRLQFMQKGCVWTYKIPVRRRLRIGILSKDLNINPGTYPGKGAAAGVQDVHSPETYHCLHVFEEKLSKIRRYRSRILEGITRC